jgi:tetratricopeptide (TPR) repeat protein
VEAARQALEAVAPSGAAMHRTAGDWLASGGFCGEAEREYSLGPPAEAAAERFAIGRCYQATGNAATAATAYERALELDPNTEEHYLSLAILLMAGGRSEEAGGVLLRAARRFPESVRTLIAMSLLHLELGYPNRARIGYEKARALEPSSPAVWKLLGRIQMAEGTYAEAVKSFERAVSIDGNDAQTYLLLGMAEARIEDGADRALTDFQQAVGLDSDLTEARIQAASIYLQNKSDYERAAAELERVLSAEPDSIRAHRLLMQVYQRQGMTNKAAVQAKEVRRLSETGRGSDPLTEK